MTTRRAWSSHDRHQARLDHGRPGAPLNGRTGMSIQANSAPTDERSALTDETQLTAHNRLGVLVCDDVGGVALPGWAAHRCRYGRASSC